VRAERDRGRGGTGGTEGGRRAAEGEQDLYDKGPKCKNNGGVWRGGAQGCGAANASSRETVQRPARNEAMSGAVTHSSPLPTYADEQHGLDCLCRPPGPPPGYEPRATSERTNNSDNTRLDCPRELVTQTPTPATLVS
jgi:hypothetical protein